MKTTIVILCMVAMLTLPSLAIAQSSQSAESPELVKSREITASVMRLFNGGHSTEALPLARQALDLREKALGINHEDLIPLLTNLAEITKSLKKLEESEAFFNRALKIAEKTYGTDNIRIAAILDRLAYVEHDLGRDAVAEKVFVRSLKLKEGELGA